jgi:hypothetical protein
VKLEIHYFVDPPVPVVFSMVYYPMTENAMTRKKNNQQTLISDERILVTQRVCWQFNGLSAVF